MTDNSSTYLSLYKIADPSNICCVLSSQQFNYLISWYQQASFRGYVFPRTRLDAHYRQLQRLVRYSMEMESGFAVPSALIHKFNECVRDVEEGRSGGSSAGSSVPTSGYTVLTGDEAFRRELVRLRRQMDAAGPDGPDDSGGDDE